MGAFFDAMEEWNKQMDELQLAEQIVDRQRIAAANQALDDIIGPLFNAAGKLQDREDRLVFDITARLDRTEKQAERLRQEVERLRQEQMGLNKASQVTSQ